MEGRRRCLPAADCCNSQPPLRSSRCGLGDETRGGVALPAGPGRQRHAAPGGLDRLARTLPRPQRDERSGGCELQQSGGGQASSTALHVSTSSIPRRRDPAGQLP